MITTQALLRCGKDPAVRFSASGAAFATWTGAHTEKRGEKEKTTWITCKAFGKTAEMAPRLVAKGKRFHVVGRLEQESWEKDGQKHTQLVLIVDRVTPVDWPGNSDATAPTEGKASSYEHRVLLSDVDDSIPPF